MKPNLPAQQAPPDAWDDKFDRIVRWYNSSDPNAKLPKPLAEQLDRWNYIYSLILLPKNQFKRDSSLIRAILDRYPDLSDRTARLALRDTRRFFASVDSPVLAFEKVMLLANAKDMANRARKRNDLKAEGVALKLIKEITGADQPENVVENRTIINVLNYNPVELGGQLIAEDKLQKMISDMLEKDKKKAENPFDDYEVVNEPEP